MRRGQSFSGREQNCCYLNVDGATFLDVSSISGFDYSEDGRGLALVDWDLDGDLDVWLKNRNAPQVRMLQNETPSKGNSVSFALQGTESNRDAIGAKIELTVRTDPPVTLMRTLRAGTGFLSQSSKLVHFGVGDAEAFQQVKVTWPNGKSQTYEGGAINRIYQLVERESSLRDFEVRGASLRVNVADVSSRTATDPQRMLLSRPLPLPRMSFVSNGREKRIPTRAGRKLLICFWASWCQPCLDELRRLANDRDDLASKGVDILALSVESLGQSDASAVKFPDRIELESGEATPQLMEVLQIAKDYTHFRTQTFPLPSSILLDREGIQAFYTSPIEPDVILKDIQRLDASTRRVSCMPLPGNWLLPERNHRILWIGAKLLGVVPEQDLIDYFDTTQAIIGDDPDFAQARLRLGMRQFALGNYKTALAEIDKSIAIMPSAENHFGRAASLQMLDQHNTAIQAFAEAARVDRSRAIRLHLEFAQQMRFAKQKDLAAWHLQQAKLLENAVANPQGRDSPAGPSK